MADAKVVKVDFNKIGSDLKKHEKRDYLEDIADRLTDKFSAHKKKIGGKRIYSASEAEELGNQLYDELTNYLMESYKQKGDGAKALKGAKGMYGEPLLDSIMEHEFKLNRTELINQLKKAAESKTSFSKKYIRSVIDPNLDEYHTTKRRAIVRDLNVGHKDAIQKKISEYLKANPGVDKDQYAPVLKPTATFEEIRSGYVSAAAQYHKAA